MIAVLPSPNDLGQRLWSLGSITSGSLQSAVPHVMGSARYKIGDRAHLALLSADHASCEEGIVTTWLMVAGRSDRTR